MMQVFIYIKFWQYFHICSVWGNLSQVLTSVVIERIKKL